MSRFSVLMPAVLVLTGVGCDRGQPPNSAASQPASFPATAGSEPQQRLYGAWVAHDVDTRLGQVKIELVLKEEGRLRLMAWSDLPFVGQVRNKTAPFEVTADTISSEAIRGGTTVRYWFDGPVLVVQYQEGKTVRFDRK